MKEKKRRCSIRVIRGKAPAVAAEAVMVMPGILGGITIVNIPIQRKPGRPRKPTPASTPDANHRRGRKSKWTDEELRSLLQKVEHYQAHHPNASDAKALQAYRKQLAEERGHHSRSSQLPALKTLQNMLTKARPRYPENSK